MNAIVLVGGLGTRLRPLTLHRPKGLLPIFNKPFLSYQLELLKKAGVTNVVFAAGNKSRHWEGALKKISHPGISLHFVYEKKLLGTGGAIRWAYDHGVISRRDSGEPVLILNGDVFFDFDIRDFVRSHRNNKAGVSIALRKVDDPSRYGLVRTTASGQIRQFIEKPKRAGKENFINLGAYIFSSDVFAFIPKDMVVSVERETFPMLLKRRIRLCGFKTRGYWNDIGTHASYLQAHLDFNLFKQFRYVPGNQIRRRGKDLLIVGKGARVADGVRFFGVVSLGRNVSVAKNVRLENSVVLDHSRIEPECVISGSIISERCIIGERSELTPGTVLGDKTILATYSKL